MARNPWWPRGSVLWSTGNGACQNSNDRVAAQDGLRTRNEGADRQATYGQLAEGDGVAVAMSPG